MCAKYLQWAACYCRAVFDRQISYRTDADGSNHVFLVIAKPAFLILELQTEMFRFCKFPEEAEGQTALKTLFHSLNFHVERRKRQCVKGIYVRVGTHLPISGQVLFKAALLCGPCSRAGCFAVVCNRPCCLLTILWPRRILNQAFHLCQTTSLKTRRP